MLVYLYVIRGIWMGNIRVWVNVKLIFFRFMYYYNSKELSYLGDIKKK